MEQMVAGCQHVVVRRTRCHPRLADGALSQRARLLVKQVGVPSAAAAHPPGSGTPPVPSVQGVQWGILPILAITGGSAPPAATPQGIRQWSPVVVPGGQEALRHKEAGAEPLLILQEEHRDLHCCPDHKYNTETLIISALGTIDIKKFLGHPKK
eukprot:CAMPEP_0194563728 /NCGR_PEP_ID=MMETSP0292-20121207/3668_1 /TAXON_ID=39354 /ORGANISM="Heterosigma akashiwo, Strain CCMP2393" /LENGTH=153 /DNA_ID=CAMNT_0039412717 /DNA_START=602 /DNA_END=1064 /DNA_ORIENTATION=+